ncbi:MAG: hypothetical protein KDE59_12385, partial [Anaerolineales bacterium]|nr:hypothetical protein [Anaerolineales bacterium]
IIDNEHYGETGQQQTHTAMGVDLAAVAAACGFPRVQNITAAEDLPALRHSLHESDELLLAVIKVALTYDPFVLPPRDGAYLKNRLRRVLAADREF